MMTAGGLGRPSPGGGGVRKGLWLSKNPDREATAALKSGILAMILGGCGNIGPENQTCADNVSTQGQPAEGTEGDD